MTNYQQLILETVNEVVDTVKLTLGTFGRTVLYNTEENKPHVTKDGVSVARHVMPNDGYKALVATVLKEASEKTMRSSGDGTTTTLIIAQYLIREGIKLMNEGVSYYELSKTFDKAVNDIKAYIKDKMTISIEDDISILKEIATISSNDDVLGDLIYNIVKEIGIYGHIEVRDSYRSEIVVDKFNGMRLHRGWIEGFFVNTPATMTYEAENALIVICDDEVKSLNDITPYVTYAGNRPIVFFVNDISTITLKELKRLQEITSLNICFVENDGFGDRRVTLMNDLAALTGAYIVDFKTEFSESNLGIASKIKVEELYTTVAEGPKSDKQLMNDLIAEIKYNLQKDHDDDELTLSNVDRKWLKKRLANLTGGIAVIHAGGKTQMEMKEVKDRLDDAVLAVGASIKEGVCYGGGYTYLNTRKNLYSESNDAGYNLVLQAIEEPFKQLLINADMLNQASTVKSKILQGEKFDLRTRTTSVLNTKVYDPCAVICDALDNSVAVAKTLLSVKQLIFDGQILS